MSSPATCPACNAALVPTHVRCASCGMEVAKMADYRRAMAAAAKRGRTGVLVEKTPRASALSGIPVKPIIGGMVVIIAIAGLYYLLSTTVFATPRPWLAYPTDEETAVRQYLTLVGSDDKKQHNQAYALLSKFVKNPKDESESDIYLQFHHDVHRYLAGEFGDDWASQITIVPTPGREHQFTVSIGPPKACETLRIQLADQSPKGEPARWGIASIGELDARSAARSNSREGTYGAMRMLGAGGAVGAIKGLVGTQGSYSRETPMESKMRLLPLVADPRIPEIDYAVMQLWKVRNDPYARVRLAQIAADERYGPITRGRAKSVLDGTLSEEDRIAGHVEGD